MLKELWKGKVSIGKIIISCFSLLVSLVFLIPSYFFTRKKGISAFKKELISAEIEQNAVEELAAEYKKIIQISQWVNLFTELKEKEQSS